MRKILLFALFLVVFLPLAAYAADGDTLTVPRLSLKRVSVSVGVDASWQANAFEPQIYKAYAGVGYQLGPIVSLVGAARLPFAPDVLQIPEYTLGLRVALIVNGKWRLK